MVSGTSIHKAGIAGYPQQATQNQKTKDGLKFALGMRFTHRKPLTPLLVRYLIE
jgi:hypothetical protein